MTKSKIEPVLQVAGVIQNTMTIIANRVTARGGNLTEALVRLGKGEARYENSLNLIAGELAAISAIPPIEIVAPKGGRVHIVHIPDVNGWNAAIDAGFPCTPPNCEVRKVENQYPPRPLLSMSTKRKIILVNFGQDIPNADVAHVWGKEQKLVPASPRSMWALGIHKPQLNTELGQKALALVSLETCVLSGRRRVLCSWWNNSNRYVDLKWPDYHFEDYYWFAFEEALSV